MKNWKSLLALGTSALVLVACGDNDKKDDKKEATDGDTGDFAIAMITDTGGVDDRSFNQSSWEGMQEWAEEHGFDEDAAHYYQSDDATQYVPNLNQAINEDKDVIYGIGYLLAEALEDVAEQNPDQYFGIVDGVVDLPNVVSLTFKDHESSFLAGVAAAYTTETDHVGFIGGEEGPVIDRFQTGFEAGVEYAAKELDKDIKVDVEYADSFSDAAKGKQLAATMYSSGADVIFHAAGGVGNGVFTEAIDRMENDDSQKLWVIGVDRDQHDEGEYEGGNLTLASTLKEVGQSVKLSADQALDGEFQGGEIVEYGLEDEGVNLSKGNLDDETWEIIEDVKQKIVDGEIEVPEFTYSE